MGHVVILLFPEARSKSSLSCVKKRWVYYVPRVITCKGVDGDNSCEKSHRGEQVTSKERKCVVCGMCITP